MSKAEVLTQLIAAYKAQGLSPAQALARAIVRVEMCYKVVRETPRLHVVTGNKKAPSGSDQLPKGAKR